MDSFWTFPGEGMCARGRRDIASGVSPSPAVRLPTAAPGSLPLILVIGDVAKYVNLRWPDSIVPTICATHSCSWQCNRLPN